MCHRRPGRLATWAGWDRRPTKPTSRTRSCPASDTRIALEAGAAVPSLPAVSSTRQRRIAGAGGKDCVVAPSVASLVGHSA